MQDKIVLVTGGAKGIGRMISEGFVSNGAKVYISSRDTKSLEQACKELNALGKGSAEYITADLYKEEDVKKIAAELQKREGSKFSPLKRRILNCSRRTELTRNRAGHPGEQQRE